MGITSQHGFQIETDNQPYDEEVVVSPDKLYFKIGEVCELTGVKQHVLRYWESEFKIVSPHRAKSKQRLYKRSDVENLFKIKRLLKDKGFTISGAKKVLAKERNNNTRTMPRKRPVPPKNFFRGIKTELEQIKRMLEG